MDFWIKQNFLKTKFEELWYRNASLDIELKRQEEVLNGLQFDLSLLQESPSKSKDQKDEAAAVKAVPSNMTKVYAIKQRGELSVMIKRTIRQS